MPSLRARAAILAVLSITFTTPAAAQSVEDVYAPLPDLSADMPLTRGELVAWLTVQQLPANAFAECYTRLSPSDYTLLFADVPTDHVYGLHLCAAIRYGIVDGYADATFRPNTLVNVAEMSKIFAEAMDIPVPAAQPGEEWYTPYLRAMASRNLLPLEVTGPSQAVTTDLVQQMMDRLLPTATPYPFRLEDEVSKW